MTDLILGFLPPWLHIIVSVASFGGLGVLGAFFPAYKTLIKWVAVLLALGFVWYSGYHRAAETGRENLRVQIEKDQAQYNAREIEYKLAVSTANEKSRAKDEQLAKDFAAINSDYSKLSKAYDEKTKQLVSSSRNKFTVSKDSGGNTVVSSTGGLSINAWSCGTPGPNTSVQVSTPNNTTATGGIESKVEARLAGETSESLISIVTDGDKAINQLNAVLDAYEKVRASGCTVTEPVK